MKQKATAKSQAIHSTALSVFQSLRHDTLNQWAQRGIKQIKDVFPNQYPELWK